MWECTRAPASSGEAARRAKLRRLSRTYFVYFRVSGVSFDGLRKKETVRRIMKKSNAEDNDLMITTRQRYCIDGIVDLLQTSSFTSST